MRCCIIGKIRAGRAYLRKRTIDERGNGIDDWVHAPILAFLRTNADTVDATAPSLPD
jgi:hypothetical protein